MKRIIPILLLLTLTTSCEDEYFSDVPDITFSNTFILTESELFNFDVGMSLAFDVDSYGYSCGYAGLILYYASEDYINAFDACCPIHYEDKEQLIIDGALAMCPTDSVYFSLLDNPPLEHGNSENPSIMKVYKTSKSDVLLQVYNH